MDCDECPSFTQNESKPDYIGIREGRSSSQTYWFVVEMKTNVSSVNTVLRQIGAGVDKIQNSHLFRFSGSPTKVIGIIVHRRRGAKAADLVRHKITYDGKRITVLGRRSDDSL